MGFRFRRTIKLGKGLHLNLSKSGVSLSAGGRGATFNIGSRGASTTLGIPGTGLSYRATVLSGSSRGSSAHGGAVSSAGAVSSDSANTTLGCLGAFVALLGAILFFTSSSAGGLGLIGLAAILFVAQARASRRSAALRAAEEERTRQLATLFFLLQTRAQLVRRANLVARFGDDISSRILAGQTWIGQTQEQLREALGKPVDIDEKVMKTKTREVWKYGQTGSNRFSTRVTLENGVVTGWDRK